MDESSSETGFAFDNVLRNSLLEGKGVKAPILRKTGTTICGVCFEGGVVLGADTRATEGPIVADKNCEKLHRLADNIFAAGAGTSADLDHTTKVVASNTELMRLTLNRPPRVATIVTGLSQKLWRYQGHVGCALVIGGVDPSGYSLFSVAPHGSTDKVPFVAMGSGSLNAMAILENKYRDGLTAEEAKQLVIEAISAGILNDLGSGGHVDVVVMDGTAGPQKPKTTYFRNVATPTVKEEYKLQKAPFAKDTTPFLHEKITQMRSLVLMEDVEMATA